MQEKEIWQSRAGRLICLTIILLGVYLLLKYALGIFLPFLFALVIGSVLSSVAKKSSQRLGGKRKSWAVFYTVVFWLAFFSSLYLAAQKIVKEAGELMDFLAQNREEIGEKIEGFVNSLMSIPSKIPFLKELDGAGATVSDTLQKLTEAGVQLLARYAGRIALGAPKIALALAVCVIASAYIAIDREKIKTYFRSLSSQRWHSRAERIFGRVSMGIRGYGRAYFWLFIINFAQLYVGLLILRIKYAFIIAFVLAFFDILPLFSAGVILVPWGIMLIVGGNYGTGVGLLLLFGVVSVVRQIAEPRLIGKELGIHPLATLVAMYTGFGFFGFWGMILAPMGVLMIKEILEESKKGEKS